MLLIGKFRIIGGLLAVLCTIIVFSGCQKQDQQSGQNIQVDKAAWNQLEKLNQTADEMYKQVSEGDITEARTKLQQMGDQIMEIRFEGITSLEGANALSESVLSAQRIFNSVKFSMEDGQVAAAKIRLATDALTHLNHPMWLQYYKVMQEDLTHLDQAVKQHKPKEAAAVLEQMYSHYAIIRPSVLISRDAADTERLDSLFKFIKNELAGPEIQYDNVNSGVNNLQATINLIFNKKDTAAYLPIVEPPQPFLWTLGIGSVIVAALAYAAWRMFQFEKSAIPVRRRNQ